MRLRNERWHTGAGLPSRSSMSTNIAPVFGAYGSTRNVSGSGRIRTSPTGPMSATGCSWSRLFIACIATVRPMPLAIRPSSPWRLDALPRIVPPLSQ